MGIPHLLVLALFTLKGFCEFMYDFYYMALAHGHFLGLARYGERQVKAFCFHQAMGCAFACFD